MEYQNLLIAKNSGLTVITLNRPSLMNALSPLLLQELSIAILQLDEDDQTRVLAITGAGRAFSAGADLNSLQGLKLVNGRVGPVLDRAANEVIETILDSSKVVIAMVNGHCYTGALELALACDLIIASESAKFGDTHARWGIRPSWGMSQRLPYRVGWLKAKELSFSAKMISASEAERIGLINKVVPDERLKAEVDELAASIMANSLGAVTAYKRLYNAGLLSAMEKGLENEAQSEFQIEDTQSRIDAFKKKA